MISAPCEGNDAPVLSSIDGLRFYDRAPTFLSSYCSRSSQNSIQSDICTRQDAAFADFDQKVAHSTRIYKLFSYESIQQGKRHFIAADLDEFLAQYYQIPILNRHCYEIIRETFPCRVYFDLEFSKLANPTVHGDDLTKKWINLVLWKINELYDLTLSWEHVMVLDSSTEVKYSKHVNLLMRPPQNSSFQPTTEYLFSDNIAVGSFVQYILLSITREVSDSEINNPAIIIITIANQRRTPLQEYLDFWVYNSIEDNINSTKCVSFIDTGVYSRNRAFRLCGSCKYGKQKVFGLAPEDAKRYHNITVESCGGSVQACRQQLLLDSFVVPHDLLIPQHDTTPAQDQQLGNETTAEYASFDIFMPYFNSRKYAILPRTKADSCILWCQNSYHKDNHHNTTILHANSFTPSITSNSSSESATAWRDRVIIQSQRPRQSSWFTNLDQFIIQAYCSRGTTNSASSSGTASGYIQSWCLYQTPPKGGFARYKQRYQIAGNRFCEHINRSHKSNGIFIHVNLMAQEVKQGCWDHDCRHFAFETRVLPVGLLPSPAEIESMADQWNSKSKNNDLLDQQGAEEKEILVFVDK